MVGITMSKEWYYNQDDAPCGPVDEPEIIRLIQSGELPPGVLVCFEGGSEWLPAHQYTCFKVEAHPKKKAPEQAASVTVPKPASAGTSQSPGKASIQPKTSGLAIASLVCGILSLCLGLPALLGIIFGIIALRQINGSAGVITGKGLAIGGLVTSALGMGVIFAVLLPALARAPSKANRVMCVTNMGQLYP